MNDTHVYNDYIASLFELPDAVLTPEESGTKCYNAAVAGRAELTTVIIPVLRRRGLDGLTVSFKRGEE